MFDDELIDIVGNLIFFFVKDNGESFLSEYKNYASLPERRKELLRTLVIDILSHATDYFDSDEDDYDAIDDWVDFQ